MMSPITRVPAGAAHTRRRQRPAASRRRVSTVARAVLAALVLAVIGPAGDEATPPERAPCATVEGVGGMPGSDDGAGVMTPYPPPHPDRFLRGATLDLGALRGDQAPLAERLRAMRDEYHIDTVGVYELAEGEVGGEVGGAAARAAFFHALTSLDMRVVVRLEAYDPGTFAFDGSDVDRLMDRYAPLLAEVAGAGRRERVAYLAVNMPLDDPRVRRRLGGGNSPLAVRRQQEYATAVVTRLRQFLTSRSALEMEIYLGVFYGWDGSDRPPSYRPAGADGYFLTSYSYPGDTVADQSASDAVLIDEPRRRAIMRRFIDQYGEAPVVVEYGVHTAERHAGRRPTQPAGLVRDRPAKQRALAATTRFYCGNYPSVRGTLYFGFNVYKREGDPPAMLDFGLDR